MGPDTMVWMVWGVPDRCESTNIGSRSSVNLGQAHLASRESLKNLPISLSRVDGHALWLSPQALKLSKQQLPREQWPSDEEVDGGEIIRAADGQPSGESLTFIVVSHVQSVRVRCIR